MTESKRPTSVLNRAVRVAVLLGAVCLSFSYGIAVGRYQWPPYGMLKEMYNGLDGAPTVYGADHELLRLAFSDPLIPGEHIHPPITSLDGIHDANRSLLTPVDRFFDAYDRLVLIGATHLMLDGGVTRVLKVTYELHGTRYDAHAYAARGSASDPAAMLIIPGSGLNRSSALKDDATMLRQFGQSLTQYILIKPNEDVLAFHDGKSKLNKDFYLNWLLDNGGSYSAHYIVNSMALTKYLKRHHATLILAGFSQGGGAVLLNALQSNPDAAIVMNGFSILQARVTWAGHDQIIIPGLAQKLSVPDIRLRMQSSATKFFFSYGKNDVGTYNIEAHQRLTCDYLSDLPNVECAIHASGHSPPGNLVHAFLDRIVPPRP